MDERQRVVKKTFTKKQLEGMDINDLVALVGEAQARGVTKFMGKMIVRDKDGNIKYDDPSKAGQYGEDE